MSTTTRRSTIRRGSSSCGTAREDWGYRTVPQAACAGRELHWPRGKVLGGSSALNGMIYARGHRSDYDTWAYLGNEGWRYDDVLPLFKRSEDFDRGASAYHGVGGPLHVRSRYEPHPLNAAVVAAAQEAGIAFNDDYNGESLDGVSFCQLNIRDGIRQSTATAFLGPVSAAPNLTVLTGARARRLLFEGERCSGIELVREGAVSQIRAEGEVVVCAGTVESPKLLLLSGIGPAGELAALGIDVVADLPGVGRNLHDHVLSPVIHGASRPVPPALPGLQQLHSHLFWRSRPGLAGPDVQPLFFHLPLYLEGMEGPPDGYTLMAGIIRPASRGSLRLASTDPDDPPLIDPACLSCEVDTDALVAAIELCREIGGQSALAEWRGGELYPGPGAAHPQGAPRVRPRDGDHLPPSGRHLQDGRGCGCGRRSAAARPRRRGPARRGRLGHAVRQLGQHARGHGDDRRARRRARAGRASDGCAPIRSTGLIRAVGRYGVNRLRRVLRQAIAGERPAEQHARAARVVLQAGLPHDRRMISRPSPRSGSGTGGRQLPRSSTTIRSSTRCGR